MAQSGPVDGPEAGNPDEAEDAGEPECDVAPGDVDLPVWAAGEVAWAGHTPGTNANRSSAAAGN